MSELNTRENTRNGSLFWRAYMFSWATLAAGALAYMSAFALHPDNRSLLTQPHQSDQESNRAELDKAQLTAQVQTLRETVASLRDDLARISKQRPRQLASNSGNFTEAPLPPVVPKNESAITPEAPTSNTAPILPEASPGTNPGTSSVRTGSIERGSTINAAANSTKTTNVAPAAQPKPKLPIILNGSEAVSATSQVADSGIAKPQAPKALVPPATTQAKNTATHSTTKPTGPKRNLAISPLRSGRVPPVPHQLPRQSASLDEGISAAPGNGPYQPAMLKDRNRTIAARTRTPIGTSALRTGSVAVVNPVKPNTSVTPRSVHTLPVSQKRPTTTTAINTARSAAQPVTFGAPKITARAPRLPRAPAALSLSAASSVTGLRASWLLLTTRHASSLAGYQPRYVKNSTGNYRLIAGPVASRFDADRVCTSLRIQGVSCGVTDYGGTPF